MSCRCLGFFLKEKQQFLRLVGRSANVSELDAEHALVTVYHYIHQPYLGENRETYKGSFQLEHGVLSRHIEGR